jgi:hypothetical protein
MMAQIFPFPEIRFFPRCMFVRADFEKNARRSGRALDGVIVGELGIVAGILTHEHIGDPGQILR